VSKLYQKITVFSHAQCQEEVFTISLPPLLLFQPKLRIFVAHAQCPEDIFTISLPPLLLFQPKLRICFAYAQCQEDVFTISLPPLLLFQPKLRIFLANAQCQEEVFTVRLPNLMLFLCMHSVRRTYSQSTVRECRRGLYIEFLRIARWPEKRIHNLLA
jgi:hypothetical protein